MGDLPPLASARLESGRDCVFGFGVAQRPRVRPAQPGVKGALARVRALEAQLADARRLAKTFEGGRFKLSAESLAGLEAALLPQIEAARAAARDASVPLVLRRLAGAGARQAWGEMDLSERRAALAAVVRVTVHPVGRGLARVPALSRVSFEWLR